MAILRKAKSKSLEQKATINWTQLGRDWDTYIAEGAPENWRTQFNPVIVGVVTDTAEEWNAEFGIEFDVQNLFVSEVLEGEEQFFAQWFDNYMDVFSEDILDTTRADLAKLLNQAEANGWTVDEMRKQLMLNFERYTTEGFTVEGRRLTDDEKTWFAERLPQYRAENIARTETMKAANAGSFELFKAWGVVELKEWLDSGDNRVRDTHRAAGSQYGEGGNPGPIPLDQPFIVGGQQMMYPLDGSLGANVGEIAQCRCAVAPIVMEDE